MARRPRLFTRSFALVTLSALGYFLSYAVLIPTMPRFVEGPLAGSKVAIGIASGAFAFTALVFRPFAGRLGDRRGRRITMVAGGLIVVLSALGMTVATSLAAVVALRLVAGVAEALYFVGGVAAIGDMSPPERRGEAISLFSVALYTGIALGPTIGETVLEHVGFDAVWLVSGALGLVASLLALPTPDLRPPAAAVSEPARARFLHPAGIAPGAVMFTSVFGFAGFMAFMPVYVDDVGLSGARSVLLVYGAILVAIRLFGARIPDAIGAGRAGRIGLTLSAAGLATMGSWRSAAGLFAGAAVFGCGQALAFPAFMALAATSAPPAERGAAMGTATAFIDLGFGLGPIALGGVAQAWSEPATFLASAAVAVGGLALHASLGRRRAAAPAEAG